MFQLEQLKIAIMGLGYVGLPLAVEFGKKVQTMGFDINLQRIQELNNFQDHTLEVSAEELAQVENLSYCSHIEQLKQCNFFIVTVPTPIDNFKQPDLTPLIKASQSIAQILKQGDVVVYESTVYPGATEEVCIPVLEQYSGLVFNQDFFVGYSPERINPGDKQRKVTNILKITSGSTDEVADYIDTVYQLIIEAGTYKAPSIKVAEAAKVIENTQRDVNIALINELALIFNKMNIGTEEVLKAAGTKWNFLPFRPGLVGGHCMGVDPYYLTHKAQSLGLHPDIRNTKIVDMVKALKEYDLDLDIYDPWVSPQEVEHEYGFAPLLTLEQHQYDAIVIDVAHDQFKQMSVNDFEKLGKAQHVLYDLKYILDQEYSDIRL